MMIALNIYTTWFRRVFFLSLTLFRYSNVTAKEAPLLPVNCTDLFELRMNDLYIDKSLIIEELETSCGAVCRIMRPAGWGKSTNLDTIKRFLEIEIDADGNRVPKENSTNYKLFAGGSIDSVDGQAKTLKPLKISQSKRMTELGTYPVIFISLTNVRGENFLQVEDQMKRIVSDLFQTRKYLKRSLDKSEATMFDYYCHAATISKSKLQSALQFLSGTLKKYFERDVYILVDDYDAPAHNMLVAALDELRKTKWRTDDRELFDKAIKSPYFEKVRTLIETTLGSGMKDNDALEKGILTGVYDIPLLRMFGGLEYDVKYTLLNVEFANFYGFSESEMEHTLLPLLRGAGKPTIDRNQTRNWYRYRFGRKNLYQPWSMRNFIANGGKFDVYLSRLYDKSITDYVCSSDDMQDVIQSLLDGNQFCTEYWTKLDYEDISNDFNVLLFGGYLNAATNNDSVEQLTVANREIETILQRKVIDWTMNKLNRSREYFQSLAARLPQHKFDEFRQLFEHDLLPSFPSDEYEAEVYFNAVVKSTLYSLEVNYTQKKYQQHRPIILLSRSANRSAIMIDYTVLHEPAELSATIEKLMKRIQDWSVSLVSWIKGGIITKIVLVFSDQKLTMEYNNTSKK